MSATTPSRDPRSGCDLLIVGGRMLDLEAASGVLDDGAIAVRDGVIVAVADRVDVEDTWVLARRIDAEGQVVAPGFVDAHVHLAASYRAELGSWDRWRSASADLVLVDVTGLHHLGTDHPVPALGLHARAADVSTVIVDGRIVVEHGHLIGIDEHALAAQARHALKAAGAPS